MKFICFNRLSRRKSFYIVLDLYNIVTSKSIRTYFLLYVTTYWSKGAFLYVTFELASESLFLAQHWYHFRSYHLDLWRINHWDRFLDVWQYIRLRMQCRTQCLITDSKTTLCFFYVTFTFVAVTPNGLTDWRNYFKYSKVYNKIPNQIMLISMNQQWIHRNQQWPHIYINGQRTSSF